MLNRAQRAIAHLPTDVYRIYDIDGNLLYVGCSVNAYTRIPQHKAYTVWYQRMARFTVHRYRDRAIALAIEDLAISTEKPEFNVTQNYYIPEEDRRRARRAKPLKADEWELNVVGVY